MLLAVVEHNAQGVEPGCKVEGMRQLGTSFSSAQRPPAHLARSCRGVFPTLQSQYGVFRELHALLFEMCGSWSFSSQQIAVFAA